MGRIQYPDREHDNLRLSARRDRSPRDPNIAPGLGRRPPDADHRTDARGPQGRYYRAARRRGDSRATVRLYRLRRRPEQGVGHLFQETWPPDPHAGSPVHRFRQRSPDTLRTLELEEIRPEQVLQLSVLARLPVAMLILRRDRFSRPFVSCEESRADPPRPRRDRQILRS